MTTYDAVSNSTGSLNDVPVYRYNVWDGRARMRTLHVADFSIEVKMQSLYPMHGMMQGCSPMTTNRDSWLQIF